ncbi:MAG TPA: hypothetical protein VJT72_19510 [Pseudonocardiaceae bacterium]|nr:hypothetical protein [Pseudonocardiaceae bacterium]
MLGFRQNSCGFAEVASYLSLPFEVPTSPFQNLLGVPADDLALDRVKAQPVACGAASPPELVVFLDQTLD